MGFTKATKQQAKLRLSIEGPSGGGKTLTALKIAKALSPKVAVLDTERGSASKYADKLDFDVLEAAAPYSPSKVLDAIKMAADAGYDTLIVDSATHFWKAEGGFLSMVEDETARMKAKGWKPDTHAAWKVVGRAYDKFVDAIMSAPLNVILTVRTKHEYVRDTDDKGRTSIKKVGMAPEIRDDFSYSMDVQLVMDIDHNCVVGKTRCDALDGRVFNKPGEDVAGILKAWLTDGAPAPVAVAKTEPPPTPGLVVGGGDPREAYKELVARLTDMFECATEAGQNNELERWRADLDASLPPGHPGRVALEKKLEEYRQK